ncbi:MFS family permease [Naumannella cuiyingiana]|uniref:MFS family permease n=1 Tax=Naumannella cuiyingiana TaxID=1347891 RepID=A0A7Z0ILI5_9ACTN|nr:MFS transporter [Naumannella cuiyingiana]NYI71660.1 MFS family permease [Naumannella cuiyingiana]
MSSAARPAHPSPPHPASPEARRWPALLSALSARGYRRYLFSLLIGSMGFWIARIAQDWLVLELTGSPSAVGLTVALQFAPVLIFGLTGGVLADRFPAGALVALSQAGVAMIALTLGLLTLTGTVQAWHVYAGALTFGFLAVIEQPARMRVIAETAGQPRIRNALSLNSTGFQSAALVGPLLAGLIIATLGTGWCFMINFATAGIAAYTLTRLGSNSESRRSAPGQSPLRQLREGLSIVRGTSEIAWAIALAAVLAIFGLGMPALLSAMARNDFGTGVAGYGMLSAALALGSVGGALLSARGTKALRLRHLAALLCALGLLLALAASISHQLIFMGVLSLAGVVTLTLLVQAPVLIQLSCPLTVRGRVMSCYQLAVIGGQAIGNLLVGRLVESIGARPALLICAAAIVLLSIGIGVAMGRQSRLRLAVGRPTFWPRVRIVPSAR